MAGTGAETGKHLKTFLTLKKEIPLKKDCKNQLENTFENARDKENYVIF
jgi:hypothetical protein